MEQKWIYGVLGKCFIRKKIYFLIIFRCILGELFLKKPIFQGNAEQTQLEIISQICGSPSPENWPEVVNLPNYKVMRSKNHYPRRLKDKFSL